jgi:hypothetical protein
MMRLIKYFKNDNRFTIVTKLVIYNSSFNIILNELTYFIPLNKFSIAFFNQAFVVIYRYSTSQ